MPSIRISFKSGDFDTAADTVHDIVNKAVDEAGGLNRAQSGAIANSLTKELHRYIRKIQKITNKRYNFIASGFLSDDYGSKNASTMEGGSKVLFVSEEKADGGFVYHYALGMVKYGWILGSDGFNFSVGATNGLVKWIKLKMKRGIQFYVYKWKRGENGKFVKTGRKKTPETDEDFRQIAYAIIRGAKSGNVITGWYKSALMPHQYTVGGKYKGNINFDFSVSENVARARTLIVAKKKEDVINKI